MKHTGKSRKAPARNASHTRIARAIHHDLCPRPRDPWAITAPLDRSYPGSWHDEHTYWTDGGDADELRDILARGMEVD